MAQKFTFKGLPVTIGSATGKQSITIKKHSKPKGSTKQIRSIINKDKKAKEKRFAISKLMKTDILADSFYIAELTSLAQGGTIDDRLQNEIRINYVHFQLTCASKTALRTKFIRISIVQDWNSLGTLLDTANWTNIYRDANFGDTAATALSADLTIPYNLNLLKVYYDKVFMVKPETEGALLVKKKIRLNKRIEYGRNQGTSTLSIGGRIYFLLHMCNADNVSTASTIQATGMIRVFFKDE